MWRTWVRGPHLLKAGPDIQFDAIENFFPGFFSGSYTFASLADFHLGWAFLYQQSFAGPGTTRPRSRPDVRDYSGLTLNGGLRYDLMTIRAPAARNPDPDLAAASIRAASGPTPTTGDLVSGSRGARLSAGSSCAAAPGSSTVAHQPFS